MPENSSVKIVKCPKCLCANDVSKYPKAYKFRCSNCGEILSMPGVKQTKPVVIKAKEKSEKETASTRRQPKNPPVKKQISAIPKKFDEVVYERPLFIKSRTNYVPLIIAISILLFVLVVGIFFVTKNKDEKNRKTDEQSVVHKQKNNTTDSTTSQNNIEYSTSDTTKKNDKKPVTSSLKTEEEIAAHWECDPKVKEQVQRLVHPMFNLSQKEIEENIEKIKAIGKDTIPALIEELDSKDSRYRRYAHRTLVELTGIDKGDSALAIAEEDRKRVVTAWKRWWILSRRTFKFVQETEDIFPEDDLISVEKALRDISSSKSYQIVEDAFNTLKKNSKHLIPILLSLISKGEKDVADTAFNLLKKITNANLEKPSGDMETFQRTMSKWEEWWEQNKDVFHPRRVEEELSKMRE